jgi:hypothetical protein
LILHTLAAVAAIKSAAYPAAIKTAAYPASLVVGSDSTTATSAPNAQHATVIGPVSATNGTTTVVIYSEGRFFSDAAAAMGYTTLVNGAVKSSGLLPGLVKLQSPAGPYDRVAYETIAWNQKYQVFLAVILPLSNAADAYGDSDTTLTPVVTTSPDGVTWSAPKTIGTGGLRPEKTYVACDNSTLSPYYGNCYVTWDDNVPSDYFNVNVSHDGGKTWGANQTVQDSEFGADPVITPNGTVVVSAEDSNAFDGTEQYEISFVSTNGGTTWSSAYEIAPIVAQQPGQKIPPGPLGSANGGEGKMRSQSLPTSAVDQNGTIYTVWQACNFRQYCSSNDLLLSISHNGLSWSKPTRLPLDSVTSTADHFLPTLTVGTPSYYGTPLGLSFFEFPVASCSMNCALTPYFVTGYNGGYSWSAPTQIAAAFNPTWLPETYYGYMIGDYFENAFVGGAFDFTSSAATAPQSGTLNEYAVTTTVGSSLFAPLALTRTSPFTRTSALFGTARTAALTRVPPFVFNPPRLAPKVMTHSRMHAI